MVQDSRSLQNVLYSVGTEKHRALTRGRLCYNPEGPHPPSDPPVPAFLLSWHVPETSQTVPPAGHQVLKHVILWWVFTLSSHPLPRAQTYAVVAMKMGEITVLGSLQC